MEVFEKFTSLVLVFEVEQGANRNEFNFRGWFIPSGKMSEDEIRQMPVILLNLVRTLASSAYLWALH